MKALPLSRERHCWFSLVVLVVWFCSAGGLRAESASGRSLSEAAIERTQAVVIYNGAYRQIDYPGGDVPANIGVCTDVVIRAYRKLGIDLQQLVHEDMRDAFEAYPSRRIWGLTAPDTNIDHRRVPNLGTFFERNGTSLPLTESAEDFEPGDIVTWMLSNNRPHIGIVTHRKSDSGEPLVVHNIGLGPRLENVLFAYRLTGHYRFSLVHAESPAD